MVKNGFGLILESLFYVLLLFLNILICLTFAGWRETGALLNLEGRSFPWCWPWVSPNQLLNLLPSIFLFLKDIGFLISRNLDQKRKSILKPTNQHKTNKKNNKKAPALLVKAICLKYVSPEGLLKLHVCDNIQQVRKGVGPKVGYHANIAWFCGLITWVRKLFLLSNDL